MDATMMGHPGVVIEFYGPISMEWRTSVFRFGYGLLSPQTARLLVDGEGEGTHKVVSVKDSPASMAYSGSPHGWRAPVLP